MPVIKTAEVTYKALPVTVYSDGSAVVTLTTYVAGKKVLSEQVNLSPEDLAAIFNSVPDGTLSRWDDLASELYGLLINKGIISD